MENFLNFTLEGSKAGIFEAMHAHHTMMIHIILSFMKLYSLNTLLRQYNNVNPLAGGQKQKNYPKTKLS